MRALAVASFPLTVTFSVLFYTDMTSLLILLLFTYSLFRGNIVLASLFAMLSLSFRQTNIVWLFFTSCVSFLFSNSPTGSVHSDIKGYYRCCRTSDSGDRSRDSSDRIQALEKVLLGGDLQCWNPLAVQVIYCQLARYSTL